jgi:hypothetical protein
MRIVKVRKRRRDGNCSSEIGRGSNERRPIGSGLDIRRGYRFGSFIVRRDGICSSCSSEIGRGGNERRPIGSGFIFGTSGRPAANVAPMGVVLVVAIVVAFHGEVFC